MPVQARRLETMDTVEDTAGIAQASDAFAGLVVYQLYGTWAGTVTFEGTINDSDWDSVQAEPLATGTKATTTTTSGLYRVDASGLFKTRVRFSIDTSGTVSVMTIWVVG